LLASEFATQAQVPTLSCDVHGAGVRSYSKEIDQAEWPRAAAAVDLSLVRPIPLNAPTLLAQSDVYHSVNPALQATSPDQAGMKVARATTPDGKDPLADQAGGTNAPTTPALKAEDGTEVRRAEPVGPMDLPTAAPVLTIPAPKPAEF
jgi:hypothetical protein